MENRKRGRKLIQQPWTVKFVASSAVHAKNGQLALPKPRHKTKNHIETKNLFDRGGQRTEIFDLQKTRKVQEVIEFICRTRSIANKINCKIDCGGEKGLKKRIHSTMFKNVKNFICGNTICCKCPGCRTVRTLF